MAQTCQICIMLLKLSPIRVISLNAIKKCHYWLLCCVVAKIQRSKTQFTVDEKIVLYGAWRQGLKGTRTEADKKLIHQLALQLKRSEIVIKVCSDWLHALTVTLLIYCGKFFNHVQVHHFTESRLAG